MWVKSFSRMFCRFIRLLETNLPSSKTLPYHIPAILQGTVGKAIHTSWSIPNRTPLRYSRPADMWLTSIQFQLPHYPTWNAGWWTMASHFTGRYSQLLLSIRLRFTECINKGGGHYARYWFAINQIMFMHILVFNKAGELGWPSFF